MCAIIFTQVKKGHENMKNTYDMKNVEIIKEVHSGFIAYMVYADTERFGIHQIMAQCISKEEAEKWCKDNGVELEQSAQELFEKEIENKGFGKIQIGSTMFRRLRKENGKYIGYGGWGSGFKYDDDLTDAIMNCKKDKKGNWKTQFRGQNRTVKFGNACTW